MHGTILSYNFMNKTDDANVTIGTECEATDSTC